MRDMKKGYQFTIILAVGLALIVGCETSELAASQQESSSCVSDTYLDLPPEFYESWSVESRVDDESNDYELFHPNLDNASLTVFFYPNFDSLQERTEYFRDAFITALLQPEISARLGQDGKQYARVKSLAETTANEASLSADLLPLISAISDGSNYQANGLQMQAAVDDWAQTLRSSKLKSQMSNLGTALGLVSASLEYTSEVLHDLFLHALTNANVVQRMEALDSMMVFSPPNDPAMIAGYYEARVQVDEYLVQDYTFLTACLNSFSEGQLVTGVELALSLSVYFGALPAAISGPAFAVFFSVHLFIDLASDIRLIRVMCAEAAVESWLTQTMQSYPRPTELDSRCVRIVPIYRSLLEIRCALGYGSAKRWDDFFAFHWRPFDILQYLVDHIVGRHGDIETFRDYVLEPTMDMAVSWVLFYDTVVDWPVAVPPMIVSHQSLGVNQPLIILTFDKDMDASSFSSGCVTLVGNASGPHNPVPSFNHEDYKLTLMPDGIFDFEESVTVTLGTCVMSLNGVPLGSPYSFTFDIEPEPQFLIATWSGQNGNIGPDQYAGAGADVVVTASPDPGYRTHRWYQDGLVVKEGGDDHTIHNIQTSHSIGVTFREFTPAAITVTSPQGGELFAHGKRMPITWSWNGEISGDVKIELLEGGAVKRLIDASTPNDKSLVWKVTTDAGIGSNFKIRVSSVETPSVVDESDDTFSILEFVEVPEWIEISTLSELLAIGTDSEHPMDAKYRLVENINARNGFQPIGNELDNPFEGVLDGNGFAIQGMTINQPNSDYLGLFALIEDFGVVRNLTIADFFIEGRDFVGTFAGANEGQIINCIATNDDGLPFYGSSEIYANGCVGGIAGSTRGRIKNCQVRRTILGGVLVHADGDRVGGIAGKSAPDPSTRGVIEYCFTNCTVEGEARMAGGIVGEASDTVRACASMGIVDGGWNDPEIGGVVGYSLNTLVTNCYSFSDVRDGSAIGGIVGYLQSGTIDRCYASIGTNRPTSTGGIVGYKTGSISNSIWNVGIPNPWVVNTGADAVNCHSESTPEMKKQATYTTKYGTNWDFADVWTIDENDSTPRLRGVGGQLQSPSGLSASTTLSDGVHVAWNAVTYSQSGGSHDAVYTVMRSDSVSENSEMTELVFWQGGTVFVDTDAQPEEVYFYWVNAAATTSGTRESDLSGPVSGSRMYPPTPTPEDVMGSDEFVKSVLIEWDATDANYYKVYRTPASALLSKSRAESIPLSSDPITDWLPSMEFVDIPPEPEEQYVYSVVAALDSTGLAPSLLSVSEPGSYADADTAAPEIGLSIAPEHPIWSQPVTASIEVQDDGIIDRVQLHWEYSYDSTEMWQLGNSDHFDTVFPLGSFQASDSLHIWVTALDSSGSEGESEHITVIIADESVSAPSQPTGDSVLQTGELALFSAIGAISALGDNLEYRLDWGDSTFTAWGDSSGSTSWSADGLFLVRAQARSQSHPEYESPWSESLPVWVDSRPPLVSIATNSGENMEFGTDTVVITGEAMEQLPGSGIDSVYVMSDSKNEGNEEGWGFKVPLGPIGEEVAIVVAACDGAGNIGADTIRVTRVVPDYTISGMAYYLDVVSSDSCSEWDISRSQWRIAIPNLGIRLYYSGSTNVAVETTTDVCGNYAFAVPSGNYWLGATGSYFDSVLYQFDSAFFDSVSGTRDKNVTGMNIYYPSGPSSFPTEVDDGVQVILPDEHSLSQNYPNPFNPSTVIEFYLPRRSAVSVTIFNLLGERVVELVDDEFSLGSHRITWDGTSSSGERVSSGIYFYRLVAEDFIEARKMVLLK